MEDVLDVYARPYDPRFAHVCFDERPMQLLAILSAQCLDRRLPDLQAAAQEVAAWEGDRNATASIMNWRFTTRDARIKLKHLCPVHLP